MDYYTRMNTQTTIYEDKRLYTSSKASERKNILDQHAWRRYQSKKDGEEQIRSKCMAYISFGEEARKTGGDWNEPFLED